MQNIYIYSNTQQFVQTLAHTYWRQSRQTKYVSKTTQLHDKILYFKIHLSLFLAKSIIVSKNRPKHLIKKWQLLYSLYIVHLTSECRRIVLKNVLLKIETSPRMGKYFLNHRRPRRLWFTYVTVLRYVLNHLRECMKMVRKSL